MSLYKISIRISWQDLCKGPLGKIPTDLYAMPLVLAKSLYKISIRGLLARSLSRAFWQDLNGSLLQCVCTRSLYKAAVQAL